MSLWELFIIAVGLSMDAFAVAICKGLSAPRITLAHGLTAGLWFGGFQAAMPLAGWLLGSRFQAVISGFDHWIAFVLLAFIGVNMIRESRQQDEDGVDASFSWRSMLPMALATSIDALAVGVTFAFLQVDNIFLAVGFIGAITFVLSCLGVLLGSAVGGAFRARAELAGGVILVLMGAKILLEHLGVFG